MNIVRRLFKNSIASFLTQISTPLSSFVLVFVIARRLGVSGLGEYSSALSMYYIFQAISSFGLNLLVTRDVAQDNSKVNRYFVNGSALALFFSFFAVVAMCVSVNWVSSVPGVRHSVYILSTSLFFYSLAVVFESICTAFEKLEYITISYIAGNIFRLAFGTLALLKGYGLVVVMIIILFAQILSSLISLFFCLRFVTRPFGKVEYGVCRSLIKAVPIFSFIGILSTLRANIDVLIVSKMLGVQDVGYYSAAQKLVDLFKIAVSSYIIALQPIMFKVFKSSREKVTIIYSESIRFLMIFVVPIIAISIMQSEWFIVLVFKEKFLPSADVMISLIWVLLFYSMNQIFANALIGGNRELKNLEANIVGLGAGVVMSVGLIPLMGVIGAGVSRSLAVLIVAALQYYFTSRYLFKIELMGLIKKPIISGCVMAGILFLWKSNIFLSIIVGIVGYLVCLVGLKSFSGRDKELIRKLFKGRETLQGVWN